MNEPALPPVAVPVRSGRRRGGGLTGRRTVVMVGLVGAGVLVLGVSRPWGTAQVEGLGQLGMIDISGHQAAPAGTAVAIAVAAASVVLTIAGRVVRTLIPAGILVAGTALAVSGVSTLHNATSATSAAVRDRLSVSGGGGPSGFGINSDLNGWGWIYVAGAVLTALAGLLGLLGSRSWPVTGRRFERERTMAGTAGPSGPSGPVGPVGPADGDWSTSADVWDALNRGEDPTDLPSGRRNDTGLAAPAPGDHRARGGDHDGGHGGGGSHTGAGGGLPGNMPGDSGSVGGPGHGGHTHHGHG